MLSCAILKVKQHCVNTVEENNNKHKTNKTKRVNKLIVEKQEGDGVSETLSFVLIRASLIFPQRIRELKLGQWQRQKIEGA